MNRKKSLSIILPIAISATFAQSCTHVFESKKTEIDLTTIKNMTSSLETASKILNTQYNGENTLKLELSPIEKSLQQTSVDVLNSEKRIKTKKIFVQTKQKTEPKITKTEKKKAALVASLNDFQEINDSTLLEHNGFKAEIKNTIKWENLNWSLLDDSKSKTEEVIEDTIQTASAATNKSKNEIEEVDSDDIQVFEYNEESSQSQGIAKTEKTSADQYQLPSDIKFEALQLQTEYSDKKSLNKYAEARLSSSVLNVIRRESNENLKLKNQAKLQERSPGAVTSSFINNKIQSDISSFEEANDTEKNTSDDLEVYQIADVVKNESSASLKQSMAQKPISEIAKNAFAEMPIDGANKLTYKIIGREVNPGIGTKETSGFEFIPHYDRNERTNDMSGEINLEYSVMGSGNVISGMVLKHGYMDIQTDLDLDSTNLKTVIPFIETEKFEKFLTDYKLNANGAYVLVNLTKGHEEVELDSEYSNKILLTSKFAKPKKDEEATFLMLTGVNPGNVFIRIKSGDSWYQKIVNTQENMITYIDEETKETTPLEIELYTESKLGKLIELNPAKENVSLFGSKNPVKKLSLNKVSFKTIDALNTQKNYLEIKNESTSFVSVNEATGEIIVPAEREKQMIMREFQVTDLANSCLIQVNTQEDIVDFKVGGPADIGEVYTQILYADREGNLSTEVSEWTNKVYVLGDRMGVLSIQVEYSNGAKRMTNSYCSNDSYLVENL